MKKIKLFSWILVLGFFAACAGNADKNFKETETGLKYQFHLQTGDELAQLGDILSMTMVYRLGDSVLFDSRQGGMPMYLELIESEYPGDIYEGLGMMAVGDSATFRLNASDFFLTTAGMPELPPFVEPADMMYFDVKLLAAMDEEGFFAEQQRLMEEQMAMNEQRALDEDDILDAWLIEQNIQVQPTASGLFYIEKEAGSGERAVSGNRVSVHYEGRLLDGTVFDSSFNRGEPIEFVLGQRQVIPGWDEGIAMMRKGGSATLVIPSHLGYGERGAGQLIPPYSTLVFEVELVDIQE